MIVCACVNVVHNGDLSLVNVNSFRRFDLFPVELLWWEFNMLGTSRPPPLNCLVILDFLKMVADNFC